MTTGTSRTQRRRRVALLLELQYPVHARWGWAGVAVWTRFVLACDEEHGRVVYQDEWDLARQLHLGALALRLVDPAGEPFTVAEFFAWTGVRKWTRRRRGSVDRLECRGWANLGRDRAA